MSDVSVTCLVDNTVPFASKLWGEHGLSFYIQKDDFRILLDTGQSGDVLFHNAKALDIDLSQLDVIVLSHGHYDHTGGLKRLLGVAKMARLIAHPAAFEKKYALKDGKLREIGMPFSDLIPGPGREALLTESKLDLGQGIYVTGPIPRKVSFERPSKDLVILEGDIPKPDPLVDDLSIVIEQRGELYLISGCCHSGIVNTIEYVRENFGKYPVLIAGGLHLAGATKRRMDGVVSYVKEKRIKKVIAGHCSGPDIVGRLDEAGIKAEKLAAGMKIL